MVYFISHNEILLSHEKKREILSFVTTWMDLGGINTSQQIEKDKYHRVITYM